MIFFAKSRRSVYFRSWNGCSTTPCIQWCFSRCFSSCSDENLFQMKSWCTQEGYKCITLAVGVQEGILFCRYFFRSRSQGVTAAVSLFVNSGTAMPSRLTPPPFVNFFHKIPLFFLVKASLRRTLRLFGQYMFDVNMLTFFASLTGQFYRKMKIVNWFHFTV